MTNNTPWLVTYNLNDPYARQIVIYADTKESARKVLKKHLDGAAHKITRIIEFSIPKGSVANESD